MSGIPNSDRRSVRRQETSSEIVDAAWKLAKEQGLAGISMRDLGDSVNMRAQSIYTYFGSKSEIYDAMFRAGYHEFSKSLADLPANLPAGAEPAEQLRNAAHRFFEFCTNEPVRYQLLFQRTIPDFEPSAESWQLALSVYEEMSHRFELIGITDPEALDLWTALLTGLVDQQISNDPGGDRWRRLIDRSVDMYLMNVSSQTTKRRRSTTKGQPSP